MTYKNMYLASNIYVARIDRRCVVLDLDRDMYIGLNADLSDVLEKLSSTLRGDLLITGAGEKALAKLLHRGLVTDQGKAKSRRTLEAVTVPQPTASMWARLSDERASDEPISCAGTVSAFVSLAHVAILLRLRPFKSTINWLAKTKVAAAHRRTHASAQNLGKAQALVDAFAEVRPYFPLKPICRLDAPSLCLHLRRNGQDAQLVFGVRLDPFAAHCWVQIGEVAITEAWAMVRQYTPILVV